MSILEARELTVRFPMPKESLFAPPRDRDRRAFLGKREGQRPTDAASPARDPDDLVVETLGHSLRVAAPRDDRHGRKEGAIQPSCPLPRRRRQRQGRWPTV